MLKKIEEFRFKFDEIPTKMKPLRLLSILTMILALGLIVSCEEETKTVKERYYPPKKPIETSAEVKQQNLWGHWVCSDFIELVKARRTVRGIRNRPMFIEIVFKPEFGDSVLLVTGYDNLFVPYKRVGKDSIVLNNVYANKNLVLTSSNGLQSLELPDSLLIDNKNEKHSWLFTKTSGIKKNKKTDIYSHINQGVLSGTYASEKNNKITLNKNGRIKGWDGINAYEICNGGKCFMLTRSPLDIVTLTTAKGKENFAFWIKTNDSLYFYSLEKMSDASEYNYQPKEVVYALKKIN